MGVKTLSALVASACLVLPAFAVADAPKPGTPEYVQRDTQNIADAYGRQTAPDGQFNNRDYEVAQAQESNDNGLKQLAEQAAAANRLAITPGNVFPAGTQATRSAAAGPAGAGSRCPSRTRTA